MTRKILLWGMLLLTTFLALCAQAQTSPRYRRLKNVIDANVGYKEMTRGADMYTLYALRSCVSTDDVGVLAQMLADNDRAVRDAAAYVLVDLGDAGKQAVRAQLRKLEAVKLPRSNFHKFLKASADRDLLKEALNKVSSPTYRPILDYPLKPYERKLIHGCSEKSH